MKKPVITDHMIAVAHEASEVERMRWHIYLVKDRDDAIMERHNTDAPFVLTPRQVAPTITRIEIGASQPGSPMTAHELAKRYIANECLRKAIEAAFAFKPGRKRPKSEAAMKQITKEFGPALRSLARK